MPPELLMMRETGPRGAYPANSLEAVWKKNLQSQQNQQDTALNVLQSKQSVLGNTDTKAIPIINRDEKVVITDQNGQIN